MAQKVVELTCYGCGARIATDQKVCDWCQRPVVVTTFNSVYDMPLSQVRQNNRSYNEALNNRTADSVQQAMLQTSSGMCYLKLGLYDDAADAFAQAIESDFDNSETYFYAAVSLLQGKKAFLHQRATIDRILEYINAAIMLEPRGIYYYFLAYIKYDYFKRKYLQVKPAYNEVYNTAIQTGVSDYDIKMLFDVLSVDNPFK